MLNEPFWVIVSSGKIMSGHESEVSVLQGMDSLMQSEVELGMKTEQVSEHKWHAWSGRIHRNYQIKKITVLEALNIALVDKDFTTRFDF